ncbi:MAG: fasciclin domain-containing protein [Sphingomonadaceae bacterium]
MSKLLLGAAALALGAVGAGHGPAVAMADRHAPAAQSAAGAQAEADEPATVGGAAMDPARDIVANMSQSADHKTLARAVRAADIAATLQGPGPFTVFAPTDAAFGRLPPGAVEQLLRPENKGQLKTLLDYHVVAGSYTTSEFEALIEADPAGVATLTAVGGGTIRISKEEGVFAVTDANGNMSYFTDADVTQSNGVVHVVNGVLLPAVG